MVPGCANTIGVGIHLFAAFIICVGTLVLVCFYQRFFYGHFLGGGGSSVDVCFFVVIKMIPSLCFYSCKCNTRVFQIEQIL